MLYLVVGHGLHAPGRLSARVPYIPFRVHMFIFIVLSCMVLAHNLGSAAAAPALCLRQRRFVGLCTCCPHEDVLALRNPRLWH
jgi:hypothetical protein